MDFWQSILFLGAMATIGISYNNVRGIVWVIVSFFGFTITVIYNRIEFPEPIFFTFIFDAIICILLDKYGKTFWEEKLYWLFRISCLISMFKIFNIPLVSQGYIPLLEVVNWLALFIIASNSISVNEVLSYNARIFLNNMLDYIGCSSRYKIKKTPWYKIWKRE